MRPMANVDYCLVFECTPTPCLLLDTQFTIIAVTPAYAAAVQRPRTDLVGKNMFVAFPDNPDDAEATGVRNLRSSLENVVAHHQADTMAVQKYDIPHQQPDGSVVFEERFWSPVNVPILDAAGALQYILHRAEDVTEFMRLQARDAQQHQLTDRLQDRLRTSEMDLIGRAGEVQESNRQLRAAYARLDKLDQLRTQFFANVSHELRTPISLILWPATQMLSRSSDAANRRDLEVITRNAQQLLRHVNALLDSSKLEAGQMTLQYGNADAAAMVRAASGMFAPRAQEHGIHTPLHLPESLPVQVDVEKLQGIVSNLLSNAFKFTPNAGTIRCTLRTQANMFVLEVADSGPGVPEAQRQAVFERFHQVDGGANRRRGGTGLGLSIVRDFASLHGGQVEVSQAPEGGALFVVTLPLLAPPNTEVLGSSTTAPPMADWMAASLDAGQAPERSAPQPMRTDLPRLLIVEDNPEVQWYLQQALREFYAVACANNGRIGLEQLRALHPDAVICDVMMPEMTGPQMLTAAKADPRVADIPILFLTAKSDDALRLQLLQGGAHDYLVKPFPIQELLARLHNAVSMHRVRRVMQAELDSSVKDLELLAQDLALQRRKAESLYLTAKEALAVRSDFLMVAAHELQTPVAGLQLQLTRLRRRLSAVHGSEWVAPCANLQRQSERLALLVSELLDASVLDQGKVHLHLADVDLRQVTQEVCRNAAAIAAGQEVPTLCLQAQAPVHGTWDRVRLEQIVTNLLSNAIKYGEGKPIDICVEQDAAFAILRVRDRGMGIAPCDQQRIFERFERGISQRNISGWGVGLYIVREAVKMLNGTVQLSSSLGSGADFVVRLPCAGPLPQRSPKRRPRRRAAAARPMGQR